MSNTDSFIEEVNEEVRQDKLYRYARKYGWIVALVIIAIVAGTALFEYRNAQTKAAAENRGDAILAALNSDDRDGALAQLSETDQSVVVQLLAADADGLQTVAQDGEQPGYIQDLARLRLAMLPDGLPAQERLAVFEDLAAPGGLYRTPARDFLVLLNLEQGNTDTAVGLMTSALEDATADPVQNRRFVELLVALGETPELANQDAPDTQN
ncbi:MAG: hypothetical protein AAF386_11085 [Pseudomonadota bacterium]